MHIPRWRHAPELLDLLVPLAALAYAWWATGLRPFEVTTSLAVVSAGMVAMVVGSRRSRPRPGVRLHAGDVGAWVVLFGLLGGWQLAAYLQHPRRAHPTLSSLTNVLLEGRWTRVVAFVLWLAGAALLARR